MTVLETAKGLEPPCPKHDHRHADELAWLRSHRPTTNVVAEQLARVRAAADPDVTAFFEALQSARETAAETASDLRVSRKSGRGSIRICANRIPLVLNGPAGVVVSWVDCSRRSCPACGHDWSSDKTDAHDEIISTAGTLYVLEHDDDKRTRDRVKARINGRGGGARFCPMPNGRRLVVTDVAIPDAAPADAGDAVEILDAAIDAVPERLRAGEISKGRQVGWLGTWRAAHLERCAEAAEAETPSDYELLGVLTADGLDHDRIAADAEAADVALVPVSAGPDHAPFAWSLVGPDDRVTWLLRKWRLRTPADLGRDTAQRAAERNLEASRRRMRDDARAARTAA